MNRTARSISAASCSYRLPVSVSRAKAVFQACTFSSDASPPPA